MGNRKVFYNSKYGIRNRRFIRRVKTLFGCADCGYRTHHAALEFDHVRGDKKYSVGGMVYSASLTKIKEEIRKCDVVCANCHSIRTFERGQQIYKAIPV